MLHTDTAELVELTPGTRGAERKLELDRRPEHYLPGGASGRQGWLESLLEHAEQIVAGRYSRRASNRQLCEEAFGGVAAARPAPPATSTRSRTPRFVWVDVDRPGQLPALSELLAGRPCHLLIESGGSGARTLRRSGPFAGLLALQREIFVG